MHKSALCTTTMSAVLLSACGRQHNKVLSSAQVSALDYNDVCGAIVCMWETKNKVCSCILTAVQISALHYHNVCSAIVCMWETEKN